jgi:Ca2+-transporting ATPase
MAEEEINRRGLTEVEAAWRLRTEGANELPRAHRRGLIRIVLEIMREPMFALLLGSGLVYFALGDATEGAVLLVFASISVLIAVIQESRSERVLEALRDIASPRALVVRDGVRQRIAGREVVRGDLVLIAEGDRIPADAQLFEAVNLVVDESILTGESAPVRKRPGPGQEASAAPGGDDSPRVFSGTLVVRGQGAAVVTATGSRSEIGRIGHAVGEIEQSAPRLTIETRRLVRAVAVAGFVVSVGVGLLYGLLRGSWLDALLAAIALEMSLLPEEFPLVLTVFMIMGAWRISQARVLTRRASAIEALGAATVLCTDKTGTLTENRMEIGALAVGDDIARPEEGAALPVAHADVLRVGLLASAPTPLDPMERAFHALAGEAGVTSDASLTLLRTWGISPNLLAVTQAWRGVDGTIAVASKGAVEAVAELCRLDEAHLAIWRAAADRMAAEGMRVLATARAILPAGPLPETLQGLPFEPLGLAGLLDPLRASVPAAVRDCRSAGIRVLMITGDYPATAQAIARAAGIDGAQVLTGADLQKLDDKALAERVPEVSVFARIMPTQKLRIVRALKANGEVVAMTGDGVNDAPSLKAADIGVAMGGRGSDVAREAASIVLLDDDFSSVVHTVRLGRRIFDNLRKAMGYILAIHIPIAGLALLPLTLGLPIIFAPVHIAFLEMVIDPVCSIVFEAEREERDIMRRPPRNPAAPLFSVRMLTDSLIQGALALAVVAAAYLVAIRRGMPATEVRALTFSTLILANFALVLANRSFSASLRIAVGRRNRALGWVVASTAALLGIVLFWPPARALFAFGPLHADDLAMVTGGAAALLLSLEGEKLVRRRRQEPMEVVQ